MLLKDYYWFFQSALDDDFCDKVIEFGKKRMEEEITKYGSDGIIAQVGGRASVRNFGEEEDGIVQPRKISGAKKTKEQLREEGVGPNEQYYARDSYVSFFSEDWIYEEIHPYLMEANHNAEWEYDISYCEPLQYTEYKASGVSGEGQFYGWHADGHTTPYKLYDKEDPKHENTAWLRDEKGNKVPGLSGNPMFVDNSWTYHEKWDGKVRKLSMTVNLSDPTEYSGGEFEIDRGPHFNDERYHSVHEIKPRGSIIVFPAYVYHQVTPVTWGERKSLVMWSIGPPWR